MDQKRKIFVFGPNKTLMLVDYKKFVLEHDTNRYEICKKKDGPFNYAIWDSSYKHYIKKVFTKKEANEFLFELIEDDFLNRSDSHWYDSLEEYQEYLDFTKQQEEQRKERELERIEKQMAKKNLQQMRLV